MSKPDIKIKFEDLIERARMVPYVSPNTPQDEWTEEEVNDAFIFFTLQNDIQLKAVANAYNGAKLVRYYINSYINAYVKKFEGSDSSSE